MTDYPEDLIDEDEDGKFVNSKIYEGQVTIVLDLTPEGDVEFGLLEGPNSNLDPGDELSLLTLARGMIGFTYAEPDRVIEMANVLLDHLKVGTDEFNPADDGEVDLSTIKPQGNA